MLNDYGIIESLIHVENINYIATGLFSDPIHMQYLMTEIENYFTFTIENMNLESNVLDDDIDIIKYLEEIIMKVAKKQKYRTLVYTPQK